MRASLLCLLVALATVTAAQQQRQLRGFAVGGGGAGGGRGEARGSASVSNGGTAAFSGRTSNFGASSGQGFLSTGGSGTCTGDNCNSNGSNQSVGCTDGGCTESSGGSSGAGFSNVGGRRGLQDFGNDRHFDAVESLGSNREEREPREFDFAAGEGSYSVVVTESFCTPYPACTQQSPGDFANNEAPAPEETTMEEVVEPTEEVMMEDSGAEEFIIPEEGFVASEGGTEPEPVTPETFYTQPFDQEDPQQEGEDVSAFINEPEREQQVVDTAEEEEEDESVVYYEERDYDGQLGGGTLPEGERVPAIDATDRDGDRDRDREQLERPERSERPERFTVAEGGVMIMGDREFRDTKRGKNNRVNDRMKKRIGPQKGAGGAKGEALAQKAPRGSRTPKDGRDRDERYEDIQREPEGDFGSGGQRDEAAREERQEARASNAGLSATVTLKSDEPGCLINMRGDPGRWVCRETFIEAINMRAPRSICIDEAESQIGDEDSCCGGSCPDDTPRVQCNCGCDLFAEGDDLGTRVGVRVNRESDQLAFSQCADGERPFFAIAAGPVDTSNLAQICLEDCVSLRNSDLN